MLPVGFEPAIPASGLSQTHALGRKATGIGPLPFMSWVNDFTLQHSAYMLLSVSIMP